MTAVEASEICISVILSRNPFILRTRELYQARSFFKIHPKPWVSVRRAPALKTLRRPVIMPKVQLSLIFFFFFALHYKFFPGVNKINHTPTHPIRVFFCPGLTMGPRPPVDSSLNPVPSHLNQKRAPISFIAHRNNAKNKEFPFGCGVLVWIYGTYRVPAQ